MKALVLAGGGAKGAFQAGVMDQLRGESFELVVGCSAGALNAVGHSHLGTHDLIELWRGIKSRNDIYSFAWSGRGYFTAEPLRRLIRSVIAMPARIPVRVCRTQLEDGALIYSRQDDHHYEDAIIASTAMPGVVVPVMVDGKTCVDGGVVENCPLRLPIDMGADDITVILCNPLSERPWKDPGGPMPVVEYMIRAFDIAMHELMVHDIEEMRRRNSLDYKRRIKARIYAPETEPMGTLDFKPDAIRRAIDLGRETHPTSF